MTELQTNSKRLKKAKKQVEEKLDHTEKILVSTEKDLVETKMDLSETQEVLTDTSVVLQSTKSCVIKTESVLTNTEMELDSTKVALDETKYIVSQQKITEKKLSGQAGELKRYLEETIGDTKELHSKVFRVKGVEAHNAQASAAFRIEFDEKLCDVETNFDAIIGAQTSAYAELKSQVSAFVSQTVQDMSNLNSTVTDMESKLGLKAADISNFTRSHTSSSIAFFQSFTAEHVAKQRELNKKVETAKKQLIVATSELRNKLDIQEKQSSELQQMVMESMTDNMQNISSFANQSSKFMTSMRSMFEKHRKAQVSEFVSNKFFLEKMVADLDDESKKLMSEVLYQEQSRALDEYRVKADAQAQTMAETRNKIESDARAMAEQHIQQIAKYQQQADQLALKMAEVREKLDLQAKELAAVQAQLLADTKSAADVQAEQMAQKQDHDILSSRSKAQQQAQELAQQTAELAAEHLEYLAEIHRQREAQTRVLEEEAAQLAAQQEARIAESRAEAEQQARAFENEMQMLVVKQTQALADTRAKVEQQSKQMQEEARTLTEKRTNALIASANAMEEQVRKLQKDALDMAEKRASILIQARADTEKQARNLIQIQASSEYESRCIYQTKVEETANKTAQAVSDTKATVDKQLQDLEIMTREHTVRTTAATKEFLQQTVNQVSQMKEQRNATDSERNALVAGHYDFMKQIIANSRDKHQASVEASVEKFIKTMDTQVENTASRQDAVKESSEKQSEITQTWQQDRQKVHEANTVTFSAHSQSVLQSRVDIVADVNSLEADLTPRMEMFVQDGDHQLAASEQHSTAVTDLATKYAVKHQQAMEAMNSERSTFVAEESSVINKVSQDATTAGVTYSTTNEHFTVTMSNSQTSHNVKHADMHTYLNMYVTEQLTADQPTGRTPLKKLFEYPKTFHKTQEFPVMLDSYRANEQNLKTIVGGSPTTTKRKERKSEKTALYETVGEVLNRAAKKSRKFSESRSETSEEVEASSNIVEDTSAFVVESAFGCSSACASEADPAEFDEVEVDVASVAAEDAAEVSQEPEDTENDKENMVPAAPEPEIEESTGKPSRKVKETLKSPAKKAAKTVGKLKSPAGLKKRSGIRAPKVATTSRAGK